MVSEQKTKELIASIKKKKELATLDDDFIRQRVAKIIASNKTIERKLDGSKDFAQFTRSKEYEELLKRIRKELRVVYGVFQKETDNFRAGLLNNLRDAANDEQRRMVVSELLATHQSTKERLEYYSKIYETIAELRPTSILDIGCGLNPLAYHYLTDEGITPQIIASDISKNDMDFLKKCFVTLNIPGKTIALDLTKEEDIKTLAKIKTDVTFMFKLLDSLEEAKRHISYTLFDNINSKYIIVSFATKSLGGKKNISRAGRTWFERMLTRKNLKWKTFAVENELFYVIYQS